MTLLLLILLIFTFNLLTFGNGPALIPLLEVELVENAQVLTLDQLLYAFAIARVTPGQANLYVASVGYFLYGWAGALLSVLAVQLPGYMMLPFIKIYERIQNVEWVRSFTRGLTVASVGLIFAAFLSISARTLTGPVTWIVFAAALGMMTLLKWNQMLSLFLSSLIGILLKLVFIP